MKIFAVHNNYAAENGNKTRESAFMYKEPVIYEMPDTALLKDNRPFFVPDYAMPCTYQVSLIVRVCRLGRHIAPNFARRYYDAMTVGVSFTADNLYRQCREAGLPWDVSKGFDGAAVCGTFIELAEGMAADGKMRLEADGVTVQEAMTADSAFTVDEIVSHISKFYMLRQGDLIYTGYPCPPNVAKLNTRLTAWLDDTMVLGFNIK